MLCISLLERREGRDGYELLADMFLNRSGANPGRTAIVVSTSESLSHANSCEMFEEKEEAEW